MFLSILFSGFAADVVTFTSAVPYFFVFNFSDQILHPTYYFGSSEEKKRAKLITVFARNSRSRWTDGPRPKNIVRFSACLLACSFAGIPAFLLACFLSFLLASFLPCFALLCLLACFALLCFAFALLCFALLACSFACLLALPAGLLADLLDCSLAPSLACLLADLLDCLLPSFLPRLLP